MVNQTKKDRVSSIIDTIKDKSNFALIEFEKTTHQALESLRSDLKKNSAKLRVVKNTLFEKAVNKLSLEDAEYLDMREKNFPLRHKSALLTFEGDWAEGLKTYYDAAKDNEFYSFKFGYIEQNMYDGAGLNKLAQLPGKDQLMAQVIGAMKNPMSRTVRSMTSPMQKLVYVLSAKAKKE